MDWDVWGLPLVVLGTSVVIGIFVAFRDEDKSVRKDRNSELDARKDQILEQIRELDADKDKMDSDVYRKLRESYLQQAEEILEQLEHVKNNDVEDDVIESSFGKNESGQQSAGWMTALVILAFFAILGGLLGRYSKPRSEGEVMTGGSMDSRVASVEQQLKEIEEAKKKRVAEAQKLMEVDPQSIEGANILTYEALLERDFTSAMKYMDIVRAQQPEHPDMLVHLGILQMSIGMNDRARGVFEKALEIQPDLGKALLWQSVLLSNLGEKKEALVLVKKSLKTLTLNEERFFAERLIEELDKPPPILSGIIEGESTSSKGVLFVIARRSEQGGGPPVAVKRIPNPTFPISFEMGKSDMMMGGVWPDQIWLSARLDEDGNAMTKDDTLSESSVIGPLEGEHQDVQLQLKSNTSKSLEKDASLSEKQNTVQKDQSDSQILRSGEKSDQRDKVTGRVVIEPTASNPKGTLFLIARPTKLAKGPPLAVRKIENPTFPLEFGMNESHIMMGGVWPDQVWLTARLDEDGNPMTKGSNDWNSGIIGPITWDSEPIQLMLKP